jgi:hypothetical protein
MGILTIITEVTRRLITTILGQGVKALFMAGLISWDLSLVLLNLAWPRHKKGQVIALGLPGHKGIWPEYRKPESTDSRSPCPALNAMANHGILPRNGRHIKWTDLVVATQKTYNTSPSLTIQVSAASASIFGKSHFTDYLDLSDLNAHNAIEHDASLTRHDAIFQPDQTKPAVDLIRALLARGKPATKDGPAVITPLDIAEFSAERRYISKAHNSQYTLSAFHQFFSGANSSIMYDVFGGNVSDLSVWLEQERLPGGWEPAVKSPFGYTIGDLHLRAAQIEFQTVPRSPVENSKRK